MHSALIDIYVAAFVARCKVMGRSVRVVNEPGVHGLLSSAGDPRTRLLVTDDLAYDVLAVALPDIPAGTINVFAAAARCAELIDCDPAWQSKAVRAMVCRDLRTVPDVPLPFGLTLRAVRRLADDAPDGVPLEDAVAVAMQADPMIDDPPEVFAKYLRSQPPTSRLFAAVDGDGAVRATSGYGASGAQANVCFVNTHPDWRRRGVGRAMTAAALRAAQNAGARQACLDASDAGLSIYQRLGFGAVTASTQFSAPGPPG